jgi:C2 domain/SHR-binding domain of vacuolar-sorting associated protein 13/PDZ domain
MNTKEGRAVELSAEVNVAPGFMSSYTKIVRFVPRYMIFNRLERPVRLWQDSSVFRPVTEEQTGFEATEMNKETRKWRYYYEEKQNEGRVNQYESIFGRQSTIEDSGSEPSCSIATGTMAHPSALYIRTVSPNELTPFLLPDTRAERQLRIDLGGIWNMSPSFSSDMPGEHILKVSRATDLRMLKHVSTRAAPRYNIVLPPPENLGAVHWDGELGVFFETDWGTNRRIVVKGTKRGHFAFNHTDIHVGDELIRINGVSVSKMSFAEAMKIIKERINLIRYEAEQRKYHPESSGRQNRLRRMGTKRKFSAALSQRQIHQTDGGNLLLVLTFSTLEERLRKLRAKASKSELSPRSRFSNRDLGALDSEKQHELSSEVQTFKVETKSVHNTMFFILRNPHEENPPFRIQNRSINHFVFFRQRGCQGHPWKVLTPGESVAYAWEEPMKSKKLTVRLAAKPHNVVKDSDDDSSKGGLADDADIEHDSVKELTSPEQEKASARMARIRQALAYQYVDNEERGGYGPATSVRLEEIGFRTFLPVPLTESGRNHNQRRNFLNCEVDTDGGTRLLIISDDAGSDDDRNVLKAHLETLKKQIWYEEQRIAGLHSLQYLLSKEMSEDPEMRNEDHQERIDVIETDAKRFVEDFPEDSTISSPHQVVVEVIEAVGLQGSDFVGSCNPYCEVYLKGRSKSRQYFFQKRLNKRTTYFIEKSLNPQWTDQKFVFDVPEEAVTVTRGHHLLIKLRNFRLVGQHPVLGQAAVHLGSIRDQRELIGWYPLAGRTGRSDVESVHVSDVGRGSIKLRVQWIYSTEAMIEYFLMLGQARIGQLTKSHDGMTEQLSHAIDSDERRREGKESVNAAGRITDLAKLQRRTAKKRSASTRKIERSADGRGENMVGKLNQGINSSLTVLKGTLKTSRDRYLQALYFQTTESKRKRRSNESLQSTPDRASGVVHPSNDDASDPTNDSLLQPSVSSHSILDGSPSAPSKSRIKATLDEFLATSSGTYTRSPFLPGRNMLRPEGGDSQRRRLRHNTVDAEGVQRKVSNSNLWLGVDHSLVNGDDHEYGQSGTIGSLSGNFSGNLSGNLSGVADYLSLDSGTEEAATTKRDTEILKMLGFVLHEHGVYFHRMHLPHHFRRSILAYPLNEKRGPRLYRPKFAAFSGPKEVLVFKSAQAASALCLDSELKVIPAKNYFYLRLKNQRPAIAEVEVSTLSGKDMIEYRLQVPDVAPIATRKRAAVRVESLHLSRTRFERAARRNLGAVLNPGGWLTVRPITALNLPDGYNGLVVRLRYGSETLVSETADARVTPRWGPPPENNAGTDVRSRSSRHFAERDNFEFTRNDLHVRVEPQQTSGMMKLAVVAEKINNKTELGVLEIPLGAAIAACLDSQFDKDDTHQGNGPTTYIRWFPLMSSKLAAPAEGDMGNSSRPVESEKPRDSMFKQYFTPCIQLAFMWRPEMGPGEHEGKEEGGMQHPGMRRGASHSTQTLISATVERYINADISRISIALVDSQRATELLSFSAMDLDARYSVTKTKTRTGLIVEWIQLDHQDPRAREPVVLSPTSTDTMQPTLQFLALKDNSRTKRNITSYEYIGVALREMDLTVEESWIFELWDFFMGVKRRRKAKRSTELGRKTADFLLTTDNCFSQTKEDASEVLPLLSLLELEAEGGPKAKLYIEQLILGLVKVNLSYIKGKKQSFELSDMGAKALRTGEFSTLALATSSILPENRQRVGDQSEIFLKWSQYAHDEGQIGHGGTSFFVSPLCVEAYECLYPHQFLGNKRV